MGPELRRIGCRRMCLICVNVVRFANFADLAWLSRLVFNLCSCSALKLRSSWISPGSRLRSIGRLHLPVLSWDRQPRSICLGCRCVWLAGKQGMTGSTIPASSTRALGISDWSSAYPLQQDCVKLPGYALSPPRFVYVAAQVLPTRPP